MEYSSYLKISIRLLALQVAVSDFLTLFSARTGEKPFWSTMPSPLLLGGAIISLTVTSIVACYFPADRFAHREIDGLDDDSHYALWPVWCWIYCLFWFFVQDGLKVCAPI